MAAEPKETKASKATNALFPAILRMKDKEEVTRGTLRKKRKLTEMHPLGFNISTTSYHVNLE
jgi:hypothetical protein